MNSIQTLFKVFEIYEKSRGVVAGYENLGKWWANNLIFI